MSSYTRVSCIRVLSLATAENDPVTPSDLTNWRTVRGLTQAQASTLLGIHRQTMNNYEKGKRPIPAELAVMLEADAPQKPAQPESPPRVRKSAPVSVVYPADMPEPDGPEWLQRFPLADPPWERLIRWRRLELADGTTRLVNPFIPHPVGRKLSCWRFVMTESGAVYDFETGVRVSGPAPLALAVA